MCYVVFGVVESVFCLMSQNNEELLNVEQADLSTACI